MSVVQYDPDGGYHLTEADPGHALALADGYRYACQHGKLCPDQWERTLYCPDCRRVVRERAAVSNVETVGKRHYIRVGMFPELYGPVRVMCEDRGVTMAQLVRDLLEIWVGEVAPGKVVDYAHERVIVANPTERAA